MVVSSSSVLLVALRGGLRLVLSVGDVEASDGGPLHDVADGSDSQHEVDDLQGA